MPAPAPPLDLELLSIFNRAGTPLLDPLMWTISYGPVLIFLCCVLGLHILLRTRQRQLGVLVLVGAIAASDLCAARLIKPYFARVRPCNLSPPASRTLEACQRGLSLPSNHASNAAAAAVVTAWAAPPLAPYAIALALLVGVSRVYLGQHWPSDVLSGWALGSIIALAFVQLPRLRERVRRRAAAGSIQ